MIITIITIIITFLEIILIFLVIPKKLAVATDLTDGGKLTVFQIHVYEIIIDLV